MVRQSGSAQRREDYEEVETRRNPYLVDYERQLGRPVRETDNRGRRPIAYESRMEEGRPAEPADDARMGRRLEVTTDMFHGYRNREPVRKGKIVQVQVPSGGDRQRRRPGERAGGQQEKVPVRQGRFPEKNRSHSREEAYCRPESGCGAWGGNTAGRYGMEQPGPDRAARQSGMERQDRATMPRGEGRQDRDFMPRSEGRQDRGIVPRSEGRRDRATMPRSEGRQERAAGQNSGTWPNRGRRQYAAEAGLAQQWGGTQPGSPAMRRGAQQYRTEQRYRGEARQSRRQRVLLQRLILGAWIVCVLLFAVYFAIKNKQAKSAGEDALPVSGEQQGDAANGQPSGTLVQGIPADAFAAHPEWTEDFLTPNEYSRPGEPLESVKNIFVHYTANPGTSAAQNRSYFEWQKDTHEASVSAHFIIGYEGEIIQCVPLDEIAYAVMTRNYDSVSIECCYLAEDGSFTQETYDSLISLLAWLTDIYGLDAEDILRHYDCGGKKCPLYYTEHEDAWEQLKKDVDKL
ncbi:peptidoglycan recognition family protein [uncultured Acetatifactor sp.]|uniref:peptidoglycan recognition family protein n=1 Tax=uncultured Acetatifactor sp. TaxID=1671927 RepID=UPI002624C6C8|nr:N-acetylmuramoyl-L-alanine amidase [uncultured Acetatifactor sp.]